MKKYLKLLQYGSIGLAIALLTEYDNFFNFISSREFILFIQIALGILVVLSCLMIITKIPFIQDLLQARREIFKDKIKRKSIQKWENKKEKKEIKLKEKQRIKKEKKENEIEREKNEN